MFSKVFENNKFKPFSEERMRSLISQEAFNVLDNRLPLKDSIYVYVNKIPGKDYMCRCGQPLKMKTIKRGFDIERFCSKACSTKFTIEERKAKTIENFGGQENYNKHLKETQHKNSIEKYGQTFQSLESTRNAVKKTNIERYGVEHNSQSTEVKKSRLIFDKDKNAYVDPLNSTESQNRRQKSIDSWSDHKHQSWIDKIKESTSRRSCDINYDFLESIMQKYTIEDIVERANCSRMTAYRYLSEAGLMNIKYTQDSIVEFIKTFYDGEILVDSRKIIKPYEIDIYIPEFKFAIEYNGIYWHSSSSIEGDSKQRGYHLMKTEMCEELGIHLFHIFENEWTDPTKQKIWKSMILNKLKKSIRIYARNCVKQEIPNSKAFKFMEDNHIQGGCYGNKYLGLFHGDELVQVAILGTSRYRKVQCVELIRLASKINTSVVGGASKILHGLDYISYGNRRWCSSILNVYDRLGRIEGISGPCYFYIKDNILHHRSKFMKHKLEKELAIFDPNLTEAENCYNNGLRRIWDSGNLVYKIEGKTLND